MSALGYLARRTYKVALIEKFARPHSQLTAYHLLIQTVVTVDYNIVDTGLRTFHNPHLQGYRITVYILFYRYQLEEKITVVHIQIGHRVFILLGTLKQQFLIVHIAGIDA